MKRLGRAKFDVVGSTLMQLAHISVARNEDYYAGLSEFSRQEQNIRNEIAPCFLQSSYNNPKSRLIITFFISKP